jgi:Cys-rich protein (TIGR01571 family)
MPSAPPAYSYPVATPVAPYQQQHHPHHHQQSHHQQQPYGYPPQQQQYQQQQQQAMPMMGGGAPLAMYPPQQQVISISVLPGQLVQPYRGWATEAFDPCGSPGGMSTCCYVTFCPFCAAGEIAKSVGRSYCATCCLFPLLCNICVPCRLQWDREAFAKAHGIIDPFHGFSGLCFGCGCGLCLLCQEINTLKAYGTIGAYSNHQQQHVHHVPLRG